MKQGEAGGGRRLRWVTPTLVWVFVLLPARLVEGPKSRAIVVCRPVVRARDAELGQFPDKQRRNSVTSATLSVCMHYVYERTNDSIPFLAFDPTAK